jgi:hypothetical protein
MLHRLGLNPARRVMSPSSGNLMARLSAVTTFLWSVCQVKKKSDTSAQHGCLWFMPPFVACNLLCHLVIPFFPSPTCIRMYMSEKKRRGNYNYTMKFPRSKQSVNMFPGTKYSHFSASH